MQHRTVVSPVLAAPQQALDYTVNPALAGMGGEESVNDGELSPGAASRYGSARGQEALREAIGSVAATANAAMPDWVSSLFGVSPAESGVAAGPPPTPETSSDTLAAGSTFATDLAGSADSSALGSLWSLLTGGEEEAAPVASEGMAASLTDDTAECPVEEEVPTYGDEECALDEEADAAGAATPCVDVDGTAMDEATLTAAIEADATKEPYKYPDLGKEYETSKGAGYHFEDNGRTIEENQALEALGMYEASGYGYNLVVQELAEYLTAWGPTEPKDRAAWLLKAIEGRFVKCANAQIVRDLEDIMNEVIIAIQEGDTNHGKYGDDERYRHDPADADYDIPILEFLVAFVKDLMSKWQTAGASDQNWLITINSLMRWGSTSTHGSGDKKISSNKGELRTGSNHGQGEAVDLAFPEGNKAEAKRILQAAIDSGYAAYAEVGVPSDNTVFFRDSDEWESQRETAEAERQAIIDKVAADNAKAAEAAEKAGEPAPEPVDPLTQLIPITIIFVGMHRPGGLRANTLQADGKWKVAGHKGEAGTGTTRDKIIDAEILALLIQFGAFYLDYRGHIHTTYTGEEGPEATEGTSGDTKQGSGSGEEAPDEGSE